MCIRLRKKIQKMIPLKNQPILSWSMCLIKLLMKEVTIKLMGIKMRKWEIQEKLKEGVEIHSLQFPSLQSTKEKGVDRKSIAGGINMKEEIGEDIETRNHHTEMNIISTMIMATKGRAIKIEGEWIIRENQKTTGKQNCVRFSIKYRILIIVGFMQKRLWLQFCTWRKLTENFTRLQED